MYAPRLGKTADVLAVMCDAFAYAGALADVEVGAMVTINTDGGTDGAEELARLAADFAGRGVVSFGTAGFVEPAGLSRFAGAVGIARAAGLGVVCHAGQTGGPGSILEVLNSVYPDRLAHGIHATWDRDLLRRLADTGVVLDVCPTSNVALGVVCDLASHPLPALVAAGVRVTLNADDSLWFGAGVSDQYELARSVFGFSDRRLAQIARIGGRANGMSAGTRERLERGTAEWLNSEDDDLPPTR
jgi:adenosine deaminase